MKKINGVLIVLTLVILALGAGVYVYSSKRDAKEKIQIAQAVAEYSAEVQNDKAKQADIQAKKDAIKEELGGIACWGGTLTAGAGDQYTYTYYMSEYFRDNGYDLPIVNLGAYGENNLTTLGRCGAVPFTVSAFTMQPTSILTEINVGSSGDGEVIPLTAESNPGINPVTISGVEGTLYGDPDKTDLSKIKQYYFSRTKSGEELNVADGTAIVTNGQVAYHKYVDIINLDNSIDTETLYGQYDAFIKSCSSGRYIILSDITGDNKSKQALDNSMIVRYGEHYLNIRKYLCSDEGVKASGIVPTDEDKKMISRGEVPKSMLGENGTLNRYGSKALGYCIFNKLEEMSYIKK